MRSRKKASFVTFLILSCMSVGCARDRNEVEQSTTTELDGTWFVRYQSLPTPFLDVSFTGPRQPVEVRVDLQGPKERFEGITLTWNKQDSEWQHPIKWLPDPLPQGLWWVAAVEAQLASGEVLSYSSQHPSRPYTVKRRESAQKKQSRGQSTNILPGAFTAPPSSTPSTRRATRTRPSSCSCSATTSRSGRRTRTTPNRLAWCTTHSEEGR